MLSNTSLLRVDELEEGMILAEPVVSVTGKILLDSGLYLTEKNIKKLRKWRTSHVKVKQICESDLLQNQLINQYEKTLNAVAKNFEKIKFFGEVPIKECEELVENYIVLMTKITDIIPLLHGIKSHNEYTFGHSLNVAIISGVIGRWLGFREGSLKDIILAGLLHDIGKILIPQEILDKPGKVTNEEMEIIKTHSLRGYRLISSCDEIASEVKLGILQHHERQDGSGYPQNLKGKEIHIYASIVAIADIYDAMSSERVYRRQLPPFTVAEIILEQMYEKLNTEICLTFLANMRRSMMGSLVLLSDDSHGKIILLNDLLPVRPLVQLENGNLIDLEQNRQLDIVAVLDDAHTA